MFKTLSKDIARNSGNSKGLIVVISFRLASYLYLATRKNAVLRFVGTILLLIYKVIFDYIMSIYIPPSTRIGGGLVIFHGFGIAINENALIGENFTVRHSVTIGAKQEDGRDCPKIGNNVNVGVGAILLGDIEIGDGAFIGAGAVVLQDVPSNMVAVGNPARLISRSSCPKK